MLKEYRRMLSYIKVPKHTLTPHALPPHLQLQTAVTRNYSEKVINSILEFVSQAKDTTHDLLQQFYEITLDALQEAKNDVCLLFVVMLFYYYYSNEKNSYFIYNRDYGLKLI